MALQGVDVVGAPLGGLGALDEVPLIQADAELGPKVRFQIVAAMRLELAAGYVADDFEAAIGPAVSRRLALRNTLVRAGRAGPAGTSEGPRLTGHRTLLGTAAMVR